MDHIREYLYCISVINETLSRISEKIITSGLLTTVKAEISSSFGIKDRVVERKIKENCGLIRGLKASDKIWVSTGSSLHDFSFSNNNIFTVLLGLPKASYEQLVA